MFSYAFGVKVSPPFLNLANETVKIDDFLKKIFTPGNIINLQN